MDPNITQPTQPVTQPIAPFVPEQPSQSKPKLSKWTIAVVVVLLLLIVSGVSAYVLNKNSIKKVLPTAMPVVKATPIITTTPDPTANWKTYTNTTPAFTLAYPSNYSIEDRSKQFPPFTLFVENKSKMLNGGGVMQDSNPYFYISATPSASNITDYVANGANNLTYLSTKLIGENSFTVVRETHGSGYSPKEQYLIEHDNFIINFSNPNGYGINNDVLNQILATFKIK
jgi:hypothetical protein